MAECGCEFEAKNREQRRTLVILLLINAVMFVVELIAGLAAQSTALLADSLDMLADASVYGLGLYAVGHSEHMKNRAAFYSGVVEFLLGVWVLWEVIERFRHGSEPQSQLMILIGLLALAANVTCLKLIARHRHEEVHMRASWIFSKNDVIANVGVIAAGILVAVTASPWPDLVIGLVIALIVMRGGLQILASTRQSPPAK